MNDNIHQVENNHAQSLSPFESCPKNEFLGQKLKQFIPREIIRGDALVSLRVLFRPTVQERNSVPEATGTFQPESVSGCLCVSVCVSVLLCVCVCLFFPSRF